MKARVLLMIVAFALVAQAQTPLQEMVQTEQAFARMAAEKTAREAFMAFIADDGLLFRPGAVNGKKWMLERPLPPSDKRSLLAWQPNFAGMAAAGDLGFTTGPSEFKEDIKDDKPPRYGHFVTLWKKQPDGSWKFVVDLGISHPQSGGPLTLWQPPATKSDEKVQPVHIESVRNALLIRDCRFSQASMKDGLVAAFVGNASPEIRLYRNGSLPYIGRTAVLKALEAIKGKMSWTPIASDVSRSGDLGYTHGTYEITEETKVIERGSYVRIWKTEGNHVYLVLDVTNPHQ